MRSVDDSDKDLRFSSLFSETAIDRVPQFCHGVPTLFLHRSFVQISLALLRDLVLGTVSQVLSVWIRGHRQRSARRSLGSGLLFCFTATLLLFFLGSIFRSNLFLEF